MAADTQNPEVPASEASRRLALYHFDYCPYCVDVRQEIERLGLHVELRDIHRDPTYLQDLMRVRGRPTVPVLRIVTGSGEVSWLPESLDIIAYLRTLRADQVRAPLWTTWAAHWLHWPVIVAALLLDGWQSVACALLAAALLFRRYKRF